MPMQKMCTDLTVTRKHINSPDPLSPPVIDPNYFGNNFGQSLVRSFRSQFFEYGYPKMLRSMRLPPLGSASGCTPSRLTSSSSRRTFQETTVLTHSTNGQHTPVPMRS